MDIGSALEIFKSFAQSGIYLISTNLLYPVIIILFILIGWSLIALGGFLYEWHARNRDFVSLERGAFKARALLKANELEAAFDTLGKSCSNKYVHDFLSGLSEFRGVFRSKKLMEVKVEKLLQDLETEMSKRLEKSRFVTRAGPMLGLMGTLIPMGPALLALAGGDVKTLADNLIIAFGSTVLGLAAGLIGHMVSMVRSRWYEQDMSDMEYLSEILFGEREGEEGLELGIKEGAGIEKEERRKLRRYLNKVRDRKGEDVKKKSIAGLVAIIAVIAIVSVGVYGGYVGNKAPELAPGYEWYQDGEFGYKIGYPENWTVIPKENISLGEGIESAAMFKVPDTPTTISVQIASAYDMEGLKAGGGKRVVINGREGYEVITQPMPKVKQKIVAFAVDDKYYVISCSTSAELFDEYADTFNKAINSSMFVGYGEKKAPQATSTPSPSSSPTPVPTQTSTSVAPPVPGYKWYHDDEFGYKISYPENWEKWPQTSLEGQEVGIRFMSDKKKPDGSEEASIGVAFLSDLKHARWWESPEIKEEWGDKEKLKELGIVVEYGEITVNDREGYEVIFHPLMLAGFRGTPLVKARWIVFNVDSNYYVIDCYSSIDLYEGYVDTFDNAINSFVIE